MIRDNKVLKGFSLAVLLFSVAAMTTAPATAVLVAVGKILTVNNSITLAGTDSTTMTFPATSANVARIDAGQTFAGQQTFSTGISLTSSATFRMNTIMAFTNTAPTCSAVGGSPTCVMTAASGSAAQKMTLGSAASATSMSITGLVATADFYDCPILLDTTTLTIWGIQTAWSTTGATWTFYTKGTATAASPGASDVVTTVCIGV